MINFQALSLDSWRKSKDEYWERVRDAHDADFGFLLVLREHIRKVPDAEAETMKKYLMDKHSNTLSRTISNFLSLYSLSKYNEEYFTVRLMQLQEVMDLEDIFFALSDLLKYAVEEGGKSYLSNQEYTDQYHDEWIERFLGFTHH